LFIGIVTAIVDCEKEKQLYKAILEKMNRQYKIDHCQCG